MQKIPYTQHKFLALNTYKSSFLKNQMLKYAFNLILVYFKGKSLK